MDLLVFVEPEQPVQHGRWMIAADPLAVVAHQRLDAGSAVTGARQEGRGFRLPVGPARGEVPPQRPLDQGLGTAFQVVAQTDQARALLDREQPLDHVAQGHLPEALERIIAGLRRDQRRYPARQFGGPIEAMQGVDAHRLSGKGRVEMHEPPGAAGQHAGPLRRVAQVAVALGVDDQDRLATQHGLGDQQVEGACLAGARDPDDEHVPVGVRQRDAQVLIASPQAVQPGGTHALRIARGELLGAGPHQVQCQLCMHGEPVEAPAQP